LKIAEELKQFATPRQIEYIDAVNMSETYQAAATLMSVDPSCIRRAVQAVKKKAALQGYSPEHDMTHIAPDPFIVRGTSTYFNKDGKPTGQWVKTKLDDAKLQSMILAAIEGFKDEIPRAEPVQFYEPVNSQLCNNYVITDYHLGMLAWAPEAGEDWDVKIAEDLLIRWFQQAIAQSPPAEYAVFAQLSDFLHFDGMDAVTPASKHLLDADTRFAKLVRVALRVLRRIINMLLAKHKHVHIEMCDANHDPVSQIWLRETFAILFENEPRVTVETSPNPYTAYEFGNVMLGFHHGHKRNVTNVTEVFAAQFREMFGRTKYAYIHTGHMHHLHIKENPLMIVEQHRTLAPADAFAARGGWLSGRDAKVITYHREFGEVSRLTINSDMLKG
jgi:hypothetical protein